MLKKRGRCAESCDRTDAEDILSWHTNTDGTVPAENTLLFAQALLRQWSRFGLPYVSAGGCHGLNLANEQTKVRGEHLNPHVAGWIDTAFEMAGRNGVHEVVSVEACVIISQKTAYVSYIMTESADKENKFVC